MCDGRRRGRGRRRFHFWPTNAFSAQHLDYHTLDYVSISPLSFLYYRTIEPATNLLKNTPPS